MMAATAARETNPTAEIVILEKNEAIGKKLLLTGGGRCNVTTGLDDIQAVLKHYPRGAKFLTSALHRFPPAATRKFFEKQGVPLKTEADQRVFPQSEDGRDIVHVFTKLFARSQITVKNGATVERVEKTPDGFLLQLRGGTKPLTADHLIIATGGQAYRQTGSTGDGYAFAESLGHSLTDLHPSLSNLKTQEKWPAKLSGVSFARARLMVSKNKKLAQLGPFLFTHRGISGPAVFALSALIAKEKITAQQPLKINIDLFPDESNEKILTRLQMLIASAKQRAFCNVLAELIPKSLAQLACGELQLNPTSHSAEISKKDLRRLTDWLRAIPLHITDRTAGEEFVTAGGIELTEVNPSTMESKLCPGLFFTGEILNMDGFTGGFNLQAAWSTGHLAGTNAAK